MLPAVIHSTEARMTSRDIADLVGSRHDKVKQSIERLAAAKRGSAAGVIDLPPLGEYLDSLGRPASEYVFTGEKGKRDSIVVVAQLSPEFTARLVDRWQELERKPVELSRIDLLRMALEAEQERLLLQGQVSELLPQAEGFLRVADASGSMSIREAAKDLQIKPGVLVQWLRDNRWIYSAGTKSKRNLAYQPRIDAGLMEHKVTLVEVAAEDGTVYDKAVSQPRITPKGLAKLALLVGSEMEELV